MKKLGNIGNISTLLLDGLLVHQRKVSLSPCHPSLMYMYEHFFVALQFSSGHMLSLGEERCKIFVRVECLAQEHETKIQAGKYRNL